MEFSTMFQHKYVRLKILMENLKSREALKRFYSLPGLLLHSSSIHDYRLKMLRIKNTKTERRWCKFPAVHTSRKQHFQPTHLKSMRKIMSCGADWTFRWERRCNCFSSNRGDWLILHIFAYNIGLGNNEKRVNAFYKRIILQGTY